MDQVGEQRDGAGQNEDRGLRPGGESEYGEADRDRFDSFVRAEDRPVDESVRVPMVAVSVIGVVVITVVMVMIMLMCVLGRLRAAKQHRNVPVRTPVSMAVHSVAVPVRDRC